MIRKISIIIFCIALFSCQHSPRKHYFVLSTDTSAQTNDNTVLPKSFSTANNNVIGVGPIDIADYLDRLHIVYTENDNTLNVLDNDYWGEPLDKGILRVVAFNLSQKNDSYSFINFPWRSYNKPQYSFRIHIHSLTRNTNQATIDASWELVDNNKNTLQRKNFIQTTPVGSGTKELVQGYSTLIMELSEDMNKALTKLP